MLCNLYIITMELGPIFIIRFKILKNNHFGRGKAPKKKFKHE